MGAKDSMQGGAGHEAAKQGRFVDGDTLDSPSTAIFETNSIAYLHDVYRSRRPMVMTIFEHVGIK